MNRGTSDDFLRDGCGRCDHYRTEHCKVRRFPGLLRELRDLMRGCGLDEAMKWGSPCYSVEGGNVAMVVARKDYGGLGFFQGSLLEDPGGLLVSPGKNSQASRELRFTSVAELDEQRAQVVAFVQQAVALREAGRKVAFRSGPEPVPQELRAALDADPSLAQAWQGLTRGRQRSHILHVGGAKQAATRQRRAEKCGPKILAGKGWNER